MDCRTKNILIWGSSIVGGLALILFILLLASGIITGRVTYMLDGEVYSQQSGASVKKYSLPDEPEKEGYEFGGWFEDEDLEEPFELNKIGFLGIYYGNKTVYGSLSKHVHVIDTIEQKATCTKEGKKTVGCKICSYKEATVTIPKIEHNVTGELVKVIKDDGSVRFSFKGKCSSCQGDMSLRNVTIDKKEVKTQATCQAEGKVTYTCTAYGKKYTYSETLTKAPHKLNGKLVSEFSTQDGEIIYGTKNIKIDSTVKATDSCKDEVTYDGRYICEHCNKTISAKVKHVHVYDESKTKITQPTCDAPGSADYYCTVCKSSIKDVIIPQLEHTHEYYLDRTSAGKMLLKCKCGRVGCDYTYPNEDANALFLESAKVSDSTCAVNGRIMHTYNDGDLSLGYVQLIDRLPHTLNGKKVSEFQNNDGSINYGTVVLKKFSGAADVKCGSESEDYYYRCEECEDVVKVLVKRPHKENYSVIKKPTCDTDGVLRTTCSDCSLLVDSVLEKLDHTFYMNGTKREQFIFFNDSGKAYLKQDIISLPENSTDKSKGSYICKGCNSFIDVELVPGAPPKK